MSYSRFGHVAVIKPPHSEFWDGHPKTSDCQVVYYTDWIRFKSCQRNMQIKVWCMPYVWLFKYGSFSTGQESLSVIDLSEDKHFHVKHYRIRRTNQGLYFISSKNVFSTLEDLVEHYRTKIYILFSRKIFCFGV